MATTANLSPRAARTRAALIAAGFDLVAAKPIDAIPIDDVVARAGVAKGSFFNHFADKHAFATALANDVRLELESQISRANRHITDPVERIAQGMRVAAQFACHQPKKAAILLRSASETTARRHPLNKGVSEDFDAACNRGLLRQEARASGVLYWLGLCQALMATLIHQPRSAAGVALQIDEVMLLGLTGLGVEETRARQIAAIGRDDR